MKVAIEGCCHGELDKIYETLECLEKKNGYKVDILLICGDFQSVRNTADMECMAVPPKHRKMMTFYKYYSGEKTAPVLTVFIGGNHEASNYLQELPYGGWVAPNIYYMGYAGVVQFGGLRIGGLSGIFKGKDFLKGHYEHPPYNEDSKRSAYHVRNLEVFRLKQLSRHVDIFMSHDWPRGVYNYGNVNQLLRVKKFLREEIEQNTLGNPYAADLLNHLQPTYWFSAHLHVKFAAMIQHMPENEGKITKFLSLDKCLPRRQFLQVIDVPHDPSKQLKLELDPEWLMILKSTNHLLNLSKSFHSMPGPGSEERFDFKVTDEEIRAVQKDFGGDLTLPSNFTKTVPAYDPTTSKKQNQVATELMVNPQTTLLCSMLDLTDPNAVFLGQDSRYKLPEKPDLSSQELNTQELDDDVDEDYESEPSFISLSGSERSFSDKSFSFLSTGNESFLSTGNESFSSLGNPDEIEIDDDDDNDDDNDEDGKSKNESDMSQNALVELQDPISDDEAELQRILKSQKEAQSPVKQTVTSSNNGIMKKNEQPVVADKNCDDNDDEEELEAILAAQRKEQSKCDTSASGSDMEMFSDQEKQSCDLSKSSVSASDSSLDCKAIESSDGDLSLQDMIDAQKQLHMGSTMRKKVMEISESDVDVEYQEIISTQKQNMEAIPDIQKDMEGLKPVYQSSPAVSMEDRVDQNLNLSFEKARSKRTEKTSTKQSPATKKFRRRNQDLYSDPSTEEDEC